MKKSTRSPAGHEVTIELDGKIYVGTYQVDGDDEPWVTVVYQHKYKRARVSQYESALDRARDTLAELI